jgi:drug/metabolite transporter (DMT)-like permease
MRRSDLASLAALAVVWGAAFMLIRAAVPEFGPFALTELRVALAALVLLALGGGGVLAEIRRRPVAFLVVGLGFSAVPFTLISIAGQSLPASIGSVLNATTPLMTALVAAAWLGHALTPARLVGAGLGVGGVLVVVGWAPLPSDGRTAIAIAASLGAAASYAFSGTFVRRHLSDVRAIDVATGQLIVAAALLALPAASSIPAAMPSPGAVLAAAVLSVVSTALAWPVFYRLLGRSGPTAASTVTLLVPVSATAWGALVLGEHVGPELLPGAVLIAASIVLVVGLRVPAPLALVRRLVVRPSVA